MESFYGGRTGAGLRIVKCYSTFRELEADFKQLNCPVKPGEYALISYLEAKTGTGEAVESNSWSPEFGNLYRRELDYSAAYCGNIAGPPGPANPLKLSGLAINIPESIGFTQGWAPKDNEVVMQANINGTLSNTNVMGTGDDLKTISGMIAFLNKKFPKSAILNIAELRGGTISIGYAGDEEATTTLNPTEASKICADWPRRYFIYSYGNPNGNDAANPLGTWVYAGQLNILSASNVIGTANTKDLVDLYGIVLQTSEEEILSDVAEARMYQKEYPKVDGSGV